MLPPGAVSRSYFICLLPPNLTFTSSTLDTRKLSHARLPDVQSPAHADICIKRCTKQRTRQTLPSLLAINRHVVLTSSEAAGPAER